jgi:hypothetical protein
LILSNQVGHSSIPVFGDHNILSAMILHDFATTAAATTYDTIPSSLPALFISGFWVLGSSTSIHGIMGDGSSRSEIVTCLLDQLSKKIDSDLYVTTMKT